MRARRVIPGFPASIGYNPDVALLLSILAFVAAGLALGLAWRSRRQTHRLALEMVQLRDRLAAAEARARDAAVPLPAPVPAPDPTLGSRLSALEERLRLALKPSSASLAASPTEDTHDVIRRRLRAEGYTHIAFLEGREPGDTRVEAERDGVLRKGRVEVAADGSLALRTVSSLRAFP